MPGFQEELALGSSPWEHAETPGLGSWNLVGTCSMVSFWQVLFSISVLCQKWSRTMEKGLCSPLWCEEKRPISEPWTAPGWVPLVSTLISWMLPQDPAGFPADITQSRCAWLQVMLEIEREMWTQVMNGLEFTQHLLHAHCGPGIGVHQWTETSWELGGTLTLTEGRGFKIMKVFLKGGTEARWKVGVYLVAKRFWSASQFFRKTFLH